MITSLVHYNGYSLDNLDVGDWESVCWGLPTTNQLGRIPMALKVALAFESKLIIWSTGSTRSDDGLIESEYSYEVARRAFRRLRQDFPSHFDTLLPSNEEDFLEWLDRVSVFDRTSRNTRTSMVEAVPFIDSVLVDRPGFVFSVTSENHIPRVLRDAIAVWKKGVVIEGWDVEHSDPNSGVIMPVRISGPLRPDLITIVGVAAHTGYGGAEIVNTKIDDLGTHF